MGPVQSDASQSPAEVPVDGHRTLGVQLVEGGLATSEQIESALDVQRRTGDRLGEILVEQGVLSDSQLARVLAELMAVPYRDLRLDPPDPDVAGRLPEAFCRRRGVLPVDFTGGFLVVAVSDPRDLQTSDDLRTLATLPVVLVMASKEALRRAIDSAYPRDRSADDAWTPSSGSDGGATHGPVGGQRSDAVGVASMPDPTIDFVNQVLTKAVSERASDVHIEPANDALRIRFRIDGMLHDAMRAPASLRLTVVSRIKIMADMDIAEHRRPQDGRMTMMVRGHPVDIRAASIPTINGEALVLRILVRDTGLLEMDALGFLPGSLDLYRRSLRKSWGMVLVTGPTGSGKSTTLYAAITELNVPTRNTVTVEDPIEYRVAGIKQTQVNARAGYTFASGLRAALRADPDTILVGEIRDLETARIATEAALTGHLVLSTLHANDAASSTTRLIDMGLGPYLVTSALECVVAQRLVRRLCTACSTAHAATPEEILEMRSMALIDDDVVELSLHRANGCPECGMTGYAGRIAVHEVMVMDDDLRSHVLQRSPAEVVARTAVAGGMQTLKSDAFIKVRAGGTTFDELKRVVG